MLFTAYIAVHIAYHLL